MIRTQIQLPDVLYRKARDLASRREISMAELFRRGLEYMLATAGEARTDAGEWTLPDACDLGGQDPFADPDWRMNVHTRGDLAAAEDVGVYGSERDGQ